jgi:hypothetical protein
MNKNGVVKESRGISCATTNWGLRVSWIGYSLYRDSVDSLGRRWAYRTYPIGGGSVGQFASLREMGEWVRSVEKMRAIDNYVEHYHYLWSKA